jgi:hypothetical protein
VRDEISQPFREEFRDFAGIRRSALLFWELSDIFA